MHHYTVFKLQREPFLCAVANVLYFEGSVTEMYVILLVCSFSFELLRIGDIPHRLSQNLGLGRAIVCRWTILEVLPSVSHHGVCTNTSLSRDFFLY